MGRDRGSTPNTPGRAVSMSRIDQLAVPRSQLGKGMSKSVNSKSMSHLALKKTSGQAANRTTGHQRAATAAQPARKPGGSTLFQTTFTSIDRNLKKGLLISSPVARCKVFKILSLPFRFMDYLTPKCIIFFAKAWVSSPPPYPISKLFSKGLSMHISEGSTKVIAWIMYHVCSLNFAWNILHTSARCFKNELF